MRRLSVKRVRGLGFFASFAGLWAALLVGATPARAELFYVDPSIGNSTMTAVFDAPLGERISAVSSAVECNLDFTPDGTAGGKCRLPLTTIVVDNELTKTEHFQQWATNKKGEAKKCTFDFEIKSAKVTQTVEPVKQIPFEGEGTFTICGRKRSDGASEKIRGTVVLFPAGEYNENITVRIRAQIENFDREAYNIGPEWTDGWLARVQRLANVVGKQGRIDLNLFAVKVAPGKK